MSAQSEAVRRTQRKRQDMVVQYRNERGCQECGEKHPAVLDLHHIDPSTKNPKLLPRTGRRNGGCNWKSLSFKDIETELKKCIVLCSNCHRVEEYEMRLM